MSEEIIIASDNFYGVIDKYLQRKEIKRILLVCGKSFEKLQIQNYFAVLPENLQIDVIKFSAFTPNPCYDEIVRGVKFFLDKKCDAIVAVGGGSAIDVAKGIKLFATLQHDKHYLQQEFVQNKIPFIAMPTTAGSGSEATKFAVAYENGEKRSITHDSCIPELVLFDASVLKNLPTYQKKVTVLDALCHAIESFWCVNSNEESKYFATLAIKMIIENLDMYLANNHDANKNMLLAANYAGKAINITQTTAGHAMSYKLTTLYKIAHGHAVALCVKNLWAYMLEHLDDCTDKRGMKYLKATFEKLGQLFGGKCPADGAKIFSELVDSLKLEVPTANYDELSILKTSVNAERLKNNPVSLNQIAIEKLYRQIVRLEDTQ